MELISPLCERACRWASLRVDGELSELESALLDDHLGRCRSCRVFARGIEDVAAALAAARLERPAPLALVIPRRRRPLPVLRSAAAATLVAAAGIAAVVWYVNDNAYQMTRVVTFLVSDAASGINGTEIVVDGAATLGI